MNEPLCVLFIEDCESDAHLTVRQLERAGYEVFWHRIESLEEIKPALQSQKWDVIISDYQLHGFTGSDALDEYLQSGLDIPFILISGTIGEETAVALMKKGAHDYLLKNNIVKLPAVVKREIADAANRHARELAEAEVARANEAIRQSEARFRAIFNNMFQFIGLMTPEGLLLEANQTALDAAGVGLDDIANKPFWEAPWWQGSSETQVHLQQWIKEAANGNFVRQEVDIHDHEGQVITLDFSIRPILDSNQKVVLLIPEGRDITEAKKSKQELLDAFDLVSDQNKRLLNFSYIISHNLRSHSSSITGILNFLESADSEEERALMFQNLQNVAHLLDETLHNLNEVVSIQTHTYLKSERLNLRDYAEKSLAILSAEIRNKSAQVHLDIAPDITINHNSAYLESILINLISNAIRYAHPDRSPEIRLFCKPEPPHTTLFIQDNGMGIDLKRNGEKLFGMYKTFSDRPGSRGLGLFISKNQVEAMGGKIEVESQLGTGTTFKIMFK